MRKELVINSDHIFDWLVDEREMFMHERERNLQRRTARENVEFRVQNGCSLVVPQKWIRAADLG